MPTPPSTPKDPLATLAARALAAGDPLGALKHVARREDPPALALRGIAMAQLGDYDRAGVLLARASRGFGAGAPLSRARCQVAAAEVALAARDFRRPSDELEAAARTLDTLGDRANAWLARLVAARRLLLRGELGEAEQLLTAAGNLAGAPLLLVARAELARAEICLRRVRAREAAAALDRAHAAATQTGIPALLAEVDQVRRALTTPSARLRQEGSVRPVLLHEVEALLASDLLVVDACRCAVRGRRGRVALAGRPVLFALARALAEAWPGEVQRGELIGRVFQTRVVNDSHRARLRVEVSRLRVALRPLARIKATVRGYVLSPTDAKAVVVLAPPVEGTAGTILALLEGGESWSTSGLALTLGISQRSVQRALLELQTTEAVRALGRGRSRRWLAPALGGIATCLLLPGALPIE